ncbi:DNA-3-methyladenine glycosylase [Paenibacillus sp. CAA11]|nr:DNA-3-methyladenine glycosylase [Paenibacillus sp. CAA11]
MSGSSFEIKTPELFRFAPCLDYFARSTQECLYEIQGDSIQKLLHVGGRHVLVSIQSPQDHALEVKVLTGGPLTTEEQEEAHTYIREWFDLERDILPFYYLAGKDENLKGVVQRFYGLRIIRIPDLFEALCWAVLGQQVNLSFAYTMKRRVTEAFGDSLEWEGRIFRCFPAPEQLLTASLEELASMKLSRMKSATILEIARMMVEGELSREGLLAMGEMDLVEKRLLAIRGIGPWTAHYVRMRCLGDQSAFPIGDAGLHNAVRELLGLSQKPSAAELRHLFSAWKGWEAYATFYLWRTLY